MSQENKKEYKHLLENVIDWAKKCLEILRFQKSWRKGKIPEAEMAGPIRVTEDEQKLVEEIFNPASTFPTKKKPKSGFDIHSIEIEVYGPKKVESEKKKTGSKEKVEAKAETPVEIRFQQESLLREDSMEPETIPSIDLFKPAEAPSESLPAVEPAAPSRIRETAIPAVPPPPVNETNGPPVPSTPVSAPKNKCEKAHLLVIDDYEPLLNMLARSLKAAGYEPICAKDGVEGIVKLHEYAVDLIITDVQMPKLDGFDLSKMLNVREETRDIPVIFLTEVMDSQTATVAKRLGAADTIIKPFTMDTLLESVKTVLASHKAVEEIAELETASV